MIAARVVQGLGGAAVLPLSLTILTTAFPPAKRGMIVGVYGGLAGLAVAMGPIVGGAVTQSIDQVGWSSAEVVGTLVAGAGLLVLFVQWESSVREPMVPLRLFAVREFAVGNLTTFFMSGAIFAGGLLVTEEFQLARDYSPVGAGVRPLPFFATPMLVSPLAGVLSDRIGRRPIIVAGLSLLTAGFAWVAWQGSLGTSWIDLVVALLIAGVGISMALPTVPTAVLSAVAPAEMGKASGINYMAQRLGAVFAIAIGSTVFGTYGGLGRPAAVTAGFNPAVWACVGFAALAAASGIAITSPRHETPTRAEPAGLPVAA